MPNDLESLRELLTTERAAIRLYDDVDEATSLTAIRACRRSHEQRAMFLSGQLRRLGAELDSTPPPSTLYGMGLASIPSDRAILYAVLLNAELRGKAAYDELCCDTPLEESVMKQLRAEQLRVVSLLEATICRIQPLRSSGVRVRLRPRRLAAPQRATMAANKAS